MIFSKIPPLVAADGYPETFLNSYLPGGTGGGGAASYELFGLSMFRNATSKFIPVMDGPVGPEHRLGPGDDLALQEDDETTVYSLTEFRPDRYVAIGGPVLRACLRIGVGARPQ